MTAVEVYREAAAGDPLAVDIANAAGRWVARAVAELVMTYDLAPRGPRRRRDQRRRHVPVPVLRALDELRRRLRARPRGAAADVVQLLPPDADAGGWGAVVLARSAVALRPAGPRPPRIDGREVTTG